MQRKLQGSEDNSLWEAKRMAQHTSYTSLAKRAVAETFYAVPYCVLCQFGWALDNFEGCRSVPAPPMAYKIAVISSKKATSATKMGQGIHPYKTRLQNH